MNQPLRFSSAASLIVLGSMIAGCAAPQGHAGSASYFGGKANVDMGYATRALAALNSNNVPMAIDLAEHAVAKTPQDAGFRALLGNAYFAGGRFHSAESAYRDALTLYPGQPQVVLKLALVEIAQGKNSEAVIDLNANRDQLDPSDYGLAIALSGHPKEAIGILERAARETNADATVRQNLALAHALAGDWSEARIIASQDVPSNQLDARIQQWMQLASPKHPADQVAALVGVRPAAVDTGQPVQLALNKDETRTAQASAAAPVPASVPVQAASKPLAPVVQAASAPVPAKSEKPALVPAVAPASAPAISLAVPPAPPPPRSTIAAMAETAVIEAKAAFATVVPHAHPAVARPRPRLASAVRPANHFGTSSAVVQLGAYQSPQRVLAAWNGAAHKYAALKAYLPMSARFASPKGTFYRLSVRGFNSVGDAEALCRGLHREGAACFVRKLAGDAPVNYASR
jgi:Flp pilus assembly protein TadD